MQFAPHFLYKCITPPLLGPGPHAPGCPVWWIRSSVSPDPCTKQGKAPRARAEQLLTRGDKSGALASGCVRSSSARHLLLLDSPARSLLVSSAQRGPGLYGAVMQSEKFSDCTWWLERFHTFPHFSSGLRRRRRAQPRERAPCLGASLQRRVPGHAAPLGLPQCSGAALAGWV